MKLSPMLFACIALVSAAVPVRANQEEPRPLYLPHTVIMNGALIPHGMYTLSLESSNAAVRVTLWRNGKFFATAPGTWAKSSEKCVENTLRIRLYPDGTRLLAAIRLAGSRKTILLENTAALVRTNSKTRNAVGPEDAPGN